MPGNLIQYVAGVVKFAVTTPGYMLIWTNQNKGMFVKFKTTGFGNFDYAEWDAAFFCGGFETGDISGRREEPLNW